MLTRRQLLRCGLAGPLALTLPRLLELRAEAAGSREPTALILVWLAGGASHLETYDPKPNAPSEFRGPYSPIETSAPGVQLSELLPEHAKLAHRFSILRSMVHTGFCHQQGTQQLLTGHPVRELKNKPDNPDLMSIAHWRRRDPSRTIPNYVGVPPVRACGAAYLGESYEPFSVTGDFNSPQFQVPNLRLIDGLVDDRVMTRHRLLRQLDRLDQTLDPRRRMQAQEEYQSQALSLVTGAKARQAFDLSQESERTRDRYGRNSWGQQLLMARRLVEAGVDLVTTELAGALCGPHGSWDDHSVSVNVFDSLKPRCPLFDQAVSALIEEVFERGLDRRVLVVVTGEFGRTPRISYHDNNGRPGRDHWPDATSILFAGGGIPGGQVIGATDIRGEQVVDRRVTTGDFLATIYRHLGIDAEGIAIINHAGRPIPILPYGGRPIPELTAH